MRYTLFCFLNPDLSTPETYLNIKRHSDISMIGKLRTSSHNLHVEMGRRIGIAREKRVCICNNGIEDEEHFLLNCRLYDDVRNKHNVKVKYIYQILAKAERYTDYIKELYEKRKIMTVA